MQVKRTQLYLTTLQMQIYIYRGDLAGAQHQLSTCIGLTQKGAEYRPGFIRCTLPDDCSGMYCITWSAFQPHTVASVPSICCNQAGIPT